MSIAYNSHDSISYHSLKFFLHIEGPAVSCEDRYVEVGPVLADLCHVLGVDVLILAGEVDEVLVEGHLLLLQRQDQLDLGLELVQQLYQLLRFLVEFVDRFVARLVLELIHALQHH